MLAGDVFALKNSGLNAFLFAEVGTEQNGSPLTVLSVLARLDKDPWAQAAEWAKMPSAAAADGLTQSILRMPMFKPAFIEARDTAVRLVMLLPHQAGTTTQTAGRTVFEFKLPEWLPLAIFCAILGLAVVAGTLAAVPTAPPPVRTDGQVRAVTHGAVPSIHELATNRERPDAVR